MKAVGYFTEQLAGLMQEANAVPKLTDNQAVGKLVSSQLEQLLRQLFIKQASFAACSQGFSTVAYKRAQFDAELDFARKFTPPAQEEKVPEGVPNPQLYAQLLQYRQRMADKHGISQRAVLTSESLRQLVTVLPTTPNAIGKIRGIARKRLQRYGKDIESIIRQYRQENQLDIHRLLANDKLEEIKRFCMANPNATLSEAKAHFGSKFDYGELRLGLGFVGRRRNQAGEPLSG